MGMFDSFYTNEGKEIQTKKLDSTLSRYRNIYFWLRVFALQCNPKQLEVHHCLMCEPCHLFSTNQ
jgi:hypothetical protein